MPRRRPTIKFRTSFANTIYDVMTARNAGIGAVGVTWGVHPAEELHDAGAHHVIDDFKDLYDIIEGLTNEGFAA